MFTHPPLGREMGDQLSEEGGYMLCLYISIQKISGTFRHDSPILARFLMNDKFRINMDGRYDQRKWKLWGQSISLSLSHIALLVLSVHIRFMGKNIKKLLIWSIMNIIHSLKSGGDVCTQHPPLSKKWGGYIPPIPPGIYASDYEGFSFKKW